MLSEDFYVCLLTFLDCFLYFHRSQIHYRNHSTEASSQTSSYIHTLNAILSNGYVFCRLTQPRLVLLGNTVSAFLEAAVCISATTLSKKLNEGMFKAQSFCSLHCLLCRSMALGVRGHSLIRICERLAEHPQMVCVSSPTHPVAFSHFVHYKSTTSTW